MSSLYESDDVNLWKKHLEEYDDIMKQKASSSKSETELISLDKWRVKFGIHGCSAPVFVPTLRIFLFLHEWMKRVVFLHGLRFQTELPLAVSDRDPKYITHEEISKVMRWKLIRGKFRPRLQHMVESNSEEEIKKCSSEAFAKLPDIGKAISALTPLKAIGPATASAILAAGCPESVPFMADESVMAIPGLQPIHYTLKHYLLFAEKIGELRDKLNKLDKSESWTAHSVELALWVSVLKERVGSESEASSSKRGTKRKSDG